MAPITPTKRGGEEIIIKSWFFIFNALFLIEFILARFTQPIPYTVNLVRNAHAS